MPLTDPPVTVTDLLGRVTQVTGNIARHRAAMAEVARIAKANNTMPPAQGVPAK